MNYLSYNICPTNIIQPFVVLPVQSTCGNPKQLTLYLFMYLFLQISLHPAHQETPGAISGSLASMAFRAKIPQSRARHRRLLHSSKVRESVRERKYWTREWTCLKNMVYQNCGHAFKYLYTQEKHEGLLNNSFLPSLNRRSKRHTEWHSQVN